MSKAEMAEEKKEKEQENKWRADGDLRTLIEAEKIKKDKPRFNAAMKMHKEMMTAMKGIEGSK